MVLREDEQQETSGGEGQGSTGETKGKAAFTTASPNLSPPHGRRSTLSQPYLPPPKTATSPSRPHCSRSSSFRSQHQLFWRDNIQNSSKKQPNDSAGLSTLRPQALSTASLESRVIPHQLMQSHKNVPDSPNPTTDISNEIDAATPRSNIITVKDYQQDQIEANVAQLQQLLAINTGIVGADRLPATSLLSIATYAPSQRSPSVRNLNKDQSEPESDNDEISVSSQDSYPHFMSRTRRDLRLFRESTKPLAHRKQKKTYPSHVVSEGVSGPLETTKVDLGAQSGILTSYSKLDAREVSREHVVVEELAAGKQPVALDTLASGPVTLLTDTPYSLTPQHVPLVSKEIQSAESSRHLRFSPIPSPPLRSHHRMSSPGISSESHHSIYAPSHSQRRLSSDYALPRWHRQFSKVPTLADPEQQDRHTYAPLLSAMMTAQAMTETESDQLPSPPNFLRRDSMPRRQTRKASVHNMFMRRTRPIILPSTSGTPPTISISAEPSPAEVVQGCCLDITAPGTPVQTTGTHTEFLGSESSSPTRHINEFTWKRLRPHHGRLSSERISPKASPTGTRRRLDPDIADLNQSSGLWRNDSGSYLALRSRSGYANASRHDAANNGPVSSRASVSTGLSSMALSPGQPSSLLEPETRGRRRLSNALGLYRTSDSNLTRAEDSSQYGASGIVLNEPRTLLKSTLLRTKSAASGTLEHIRRQSVALFSILKDHVSINANTLSSTGTRSDSKLGPSEHQTTKASTAALSYAKEDLIVTNFEQTPFTQRYHDAIRSEQQRIRELIQTVMDDESDTYNDVLLGFEKDVPEHLSNSILCPLHPLHKSGGRGICPQHGLPKRHNSNATVLMSNKTFPSPKTGVTSAEAKHRTRRSSEYGSKRMEPILQTEEEFDRRFSRVGSDGHVSPMETEWPRGRSSRRDSVKKDPGWQAPEDWGWDEV